MREAPNQRIVSQVEDWLRLAEMDLEVAEYLFSYHKIPVEIICYHSQQSAEKYIKALLVLHGEEPPKTHNLVDLARICREKEILGYMWDDMVREIVGLNRFGTVPRYPSKIELSASDAHRAVSDASALKNVIMEEISRLLS